jgi:hypothetical protein
MHTLDKLDALQNALNESNRHHAALNGAMVIALIDKGILTREEFERAYAQATATIDQEAARLRDQTE